MFVDAILMEETTSLCLSSPLVQKQASPPPALTGCGGEKILDVKVRIASKTLKREGGVGVKNSCMGVCGEEDIYADRL